MSAFYLLQQTQLINRDTKFKASNPMSVIIATNTAGPSNSGPGVSLVLYSEHPFNAIAPSAAGDNSIALGSGAQTAIGASGSLAIGLHSLARHAGAIMHSSGRFGTSGDIQSGRYLLRSHSVGTMPAELFIDGTNGNKRLILPDDCTWTFTITVTAHRQDVPDGHAGYKFEGVVFRNAGVDTVSFQGTPIKTIIAESNAAWDINISTDPERGALVLKASGESAKIIRWGALVETLEVTN